MLAYWIGFFSVDGSVVRSYMVSKEKCDTLEKAIDYAKSNHSLWYNRGVCIDIYSYILVNLPNNIDDARNLALDSSRKENVLWFEEKV